MTAIVCHACHSPVDLATAPPPRIRGAKVVSFCSVACADGVVRDNPNKPAPIAALEGTAANAPAPQVVAKVAPPDAVDAADAGTDIEPIVPAQAVHDFMTATQPRGSRKRKIVALSAAIMVGGMAITIINAVSPSTPSDVRAEENRIETSAPVGSSVDPAAMAMTGTGSGLADGMASGTPARASEGAPDGVADDTATRPTPLRLLPPTPENLRIAAIQSLRQLMESPSDRMRRIAALALSRAGDPQALAQLQSLLEDESAALHKVEIAYGLARAGDVPAKKLLRRRLSHKRRDVRVDAARALVALGDDEGVPVLEAMLSLRTHRLGAAGLLAQLNHPRGKSVLEKEFNDESSSTENRIRAAVALGRAGDPSVRDYLRALLDDGRYHVGAADALATLGDSTAVPALTRQLELPSLRVRAAIALRRMGADVDVAVLEAALETGSDPARVSAAEAILILTGPKPIAELD